MDNEINNNRVKLNNEITENIQIRKNRENLLEILYFNMKKKKDIIRDIQDNIAILILLEKIQI